MLGLPPWVLDHPASHSRKRERCSTPPPQVTSSRCRPPAPGCPQLGYDARNGGPERFSFTEIRQTCMHADSGLPYMASPHCAMPDMYCLVSVHPEHIRSCRCSYALPSASQRASSRKDPPRMDRSNRRTRACASRHRLCSLSSSALCQRASHRRRPNRACTRLQRLHPWPLLPTGWSRVVARSAQRQTSRWLTNTWWSTWLCSWRMRSSHGFCFARTARGRGSWNESPPSCCPAVRLAGRHRVLRRLSHLQHAQSDGLAGDARSQPWCQVLLVRAEQERLHPIRTRRA
jgi:hypothetical protein